MSKVNVISGFLGAGKTTFIKELLQKVFNGQKVVLIENEFGEIGIDGSFLKEAGIQITEMNQGCICCSLVGDFSKALSKVIEEYNPDRILIEPSGVGKLSDVVKAIDGVSGVELENSITVVDAKKAKKYLKNFGEFFNNQVENADSIILSRTADIEEEKLHECLHIIRDLNDDASVITTPWDKLDKEVLLSALTQKHDHDILEDEHHHHHHEDGECDDPNCSCHHHDHEHHYHHADEVFATVGGETVHKFSKDELDSILSKLANTDELGTVLRSKGIVSLDDDTWVEFDLVPEETEIRSCKADYIGRIVVIGSQLKEEELKKLFYI